MVRVEVGTGQYGRGPEREIGGHEDRLEIKKVELKLPVEEPWGAITDAGLEPREFGIAV